MRGTQLVAGGDGQLEEGRGGQQRGPGDDVVGQPGLGAHGDTAGQYGVPAFGQVHDRAEQGVACGVEAEPPGARGGRRREPEVLSLEGVGGQVDRGTAGEEGGRGERCTDGVGAGDAVGDGLGLGGRPA